MKKPDTTSWILLLILSCIWGSSFILMKLGMEVFPDDAVAALRLSFAFLFVLPFWFFRFRKEHFKHWPALMVSGVFGNLFPAFLFTFAETQVSSVQAGMLNSFTPLATLVLGSIFWNVKAGKEGILGVLLGLCGACGLFLFGEGEDNSRWIYSAAVILATLMYGLSVNVIRQYLSELDPLTITMWSMTFCGLPGLIYVLTGDTIAILAENEHAGRSLFFIGILGVIGSAVSVILFNRLIQRSTALFASSVTYLIPVVSLLLGLTYNESVSTGQVCSMGLILSGIWVINKRK
ncbi:MAG: DMT family transporter [Bacteroidia bacterium]|nr:DMT family transporter [Bacteroidia bacterium]